MSHPRIPVHHKQLKTSPTSDFSRYTRRLVQIHYLGVSSEICSSESSRRHQPLSDTYNRVWVRPSHSDSRGTLSNYLRGVTLERTRSGIRGEGNRLRHRKRTLFGIGIPIVESHLRHSGRSLNASESYPWHKGTWNVNHSFHSQDTYLSRVWRRKVRSLSVLSLLFLTSNHKGNTDSNPEGEEVVGEGKGDKQNVPWGDPGLKVNSYFFTFTNRLVNGRT